MSDYDGFGAMRDLSSEIAQLRADLATVTAERDEFRTTLHLTEDCLKVADTELAETRKALAVVAAELARRSGT